MLLSALTALLRIVRTCRAYKTVPTLTTSDYTLKHATYYNITSNTHMAYPNNTISIPQLHPGTALDKAQGMQQHDGLCKLTA